MRVSNRSTYRGIQLQLSDIAGQMKSERPDFFGKTDQPAFG